MQAQSRICPICIDDHAEDRNCKTADLVERIETLNRRLRFLIDHVPTLLAIGERENGKPLAEWLHRTGEGGIEQAIVYWERFQGGGKRVDEG